MSETTARKTDSKETALTMIVISLLICICNFFFTVAVGWSHAFGAAMNANPYPAPRQLDVYDVLFEVDGFTCLASIAMSILLLVLFHRLHSKLYYPTRLLILLTAFQIVASTVIALHEFR